MSELEINESHLMRSNITDDVIGAIEDKLKQHCNEFGLGTMQSDEVFEGFSDSINETLDTILAKDLMEYVDNLVVNYDFHAYVKEYVDNG